MQLTFVVTLKFFSFFIQLLPLLFYFFPLLFQTPCCDFVFSIELNEKTINIKTYILNERSLECTMTVSQIILLCFKVKITTCQPHSKQRGLLHAMASQSLLGKKFWALKLN